MCLHRGYGGTAALGEARVRAVRYSTGDLPKEGATIVLEDAPVHFDGRALRAAAECGGLDLATSAALAAEQRDLVFDMQNFVPGLELAERFYHEAVSPILSRAFSGLRHGAALIGSGSEVLGFDTPMSTDHHWGPRAMLFLEEADHPRYADRVRDCLAEQLPHDFLGWPTNFSEPDPLDQGTQHLQATMQGRINHRVDVWTLHGLVHEELGLDLRESMDPYDWLTLPTQKLRSIVAGAVFRDDVGLEELRARFTWYPHDVWLWLLAAGWKRIAQGEHLMGRAGEAGDDLGSTLIAARLVDDAMRLCFLMERQYAPYPKWLGTAFGTLEAAPVLTPLLRRVVRADDWQERDRALAEVYEALAKRHNATGLTAPISTETRQFFGRPFTVISGGRFTDALKERIEDERVRRIPFDIGGIDQWSDSTDLREATHLRPRLRALYESGE